jgi:hypothetical protein
LSEEANSVPIENLPEKCAYLHVLLAKYDKKDIYNTDETDLFFRMKPNQTLSTSPTSGYKMVSFILEFVLLNKLNDLNIFFIFFIG